MRRALALIATAAAAVVLTPFAPASAADDLDANSVVLAVTDIAPSTPTPSAKKHPLTFSLTVENTTDQTLSDVSISADRVTPIFGAADLDASLTKPPEVNPDLVAGVHTDPVQVDLTAGESLPVTFATSTSTLNDGSAGICLCGDFIYPIQFIATYTDADGVATTVGTTTTYLPSLPSMVGTTAPDPLKVSWIWPLLDRPHRFDDPRLFRDDDLVEQVRIGGRLDRALQVLEQVAGSVPMTVVTDPELLDELEVVAGGNYRVYSASARPRRSVPGTGADVAQAWLTRFTALLTEHPDLQLELTAYADPDVETLTDSGLTWAQSLADSGAATRLADALGSRAAQHAVAWPYGSTLSQDTLAALVRHGTSAAVLTDRSFTKGRSNADLNSLTRIRTADGDVTAIVTSSSLQAAVRSVLAPDGKGLAALPALVSKLAVRVVAPLYDSVTNQAPYAPHYVALAAPRDLDVDPAIAARAVLATAYLFWVAPRTVTDAIGDDAITASSRGALRLVKVAKIPTKTVESIRSVHNTLQGLTGKGGLFDTNTASGTGDNDAATSTSTVLATLDRIPTGMQRAASTGFIADPELSVERSDVLASYVNGIRAAVHLVRPAGNASYTLTSGDAPLPVTVSNPLDTEVRVKITVFAQDNKPGVRTTSTTRVIPAQTTQQERVPVHVEYNGRVFMQVSLSTAGRRSMILGPSAGNLTISVRNTALGTVGVAITTIAAIVLGIALLVRLYRAIAWRRRRGDTPPAEPDPLSP